MIEFATIEALISEAGLSINDVTHIEIDTNSVTFTVFVKTPDGQILSYLDAAMFVQKVVPIHRPEEHVHDGTEDHVHE